MKRAKTRSEYLIYELYGAIGKYIQDGPLSSQLVLADVEFLMMRMALNRSKSIKEAAKLLLVTESFFVSRLKKLGLYDCRFSELDGGPVTSKKRTNLSPMFKITLPMAKS